MHSWAYSQPALVFPVITPIPICAASKCDSTPVAEMWIGGCGSCTGRGARLRGGMS